MFKTGLSVLLVLCLSSGVFAQGPKWISALGRLGKQESKQAARADGAETAASAAANSFKRAAFAERGLADRLKAQFSKTAAYAQRVEAQMDRAVFQILNDEGLPHGTGFVFERERNGRKEIWGAAVAHLTKHKGDIVPCKFYLGDGQYQTVPLEVKMRGTAGYHNPDMVLLEIPKELWPRVFALEVGSGDLKRGQKATSYGYHGRNIGSELIRTQDRRVISSEGWRLITTYNYGTDVHHAPGACGSPLMRDGKVVGMHVGSNFGKCSYVLNFERLSNIFFNEMDGRHFYRDVKIFGRPILRLGLSQRVSDVEIYRNGVPVQNTCITMYPRPVDYRRLEDVLPVKPGDVVRFRITTDGREARDFIEYHLPE